MSRRNFLQWMSSGLAVATFPQLIACGSGSGGGNSAGEPGSGTGGGNPPAPGAGTQGTPVSPAQRQAALAGIEAELARLVGTGTTFDPAAMVSYLQQQSAFYEVGYTEASACAWAVFTDERKVLILNNLGLTAPPTAARAKRIASAPPATEAAAALRTAAATPSADDPLVTRSTFRLINQWEGSAFWEAYPVLDYSHTTEEWVDADTIPRIGRIARGLNFSMVEPDLLVGHHGSVEGLKTVSGDGVFFLTGSGGYMDTSSGRVNGICTRTPASFDGTGYDADHDSGSLIYAVAVDDVNPEPRTVHAITPRFIQQYGWSFPRLESLVFLNTTGGGIGDWLDPLYEAGALLVMGWVDAVEARTLLGVAQDFFELELATNHITPGAPAWMEPLSAEPRMRSYGIQETYSYLSRRQLINTLTDAQGGRTNRLEMVPAAGFRLSQLRPSIEWLGISEANGIQEGEIQLQGQFGQELGAPRVLIGTETEEIRDGTPNNALVPELEMVADRPLSGSTEELNIFEWRPTLIRMLLPSDGKRQAGMVQVWLDDQATAGGLAPSRFSNIVHLTRWTIPFQINRTIGGTTLLRSVTAEVSIRAFVSGYRLWPDQPLDQQWPFVAVTNMAEATIGWSASGSASRTESGTTTTVSWSGTGNFLGRSDPLSLSFALGGVLWINERRLNCSLEMSLLDGLEVRTNAGDPVFSDFKVGTQEAPPTAPGGPLSLYFDPDWKLRAGSVIFPDQAESELGYDSCETQITWPGVTPEFPPEIDRGGR